MHSTTLQLLPPFPFVFFPCNDGIPTCEYHRSRLCLVISQNDLCMFLRSPELPHLSQVPLSGSKCEFKLRCVVSDFTPGVVMLLNFSRTDVWFLNFKKSCLELVRRRNYMVQNGILWSAGCWSLVLDWRKTHHMHSLWAGKNSTEKQEWIMCRKYLEERMQLLKVSPAVIHCVSNWNKLNNTW